MTSARQIRANRENAKRSTGPRSGAGKARSSFNSLRHGLAAAVSSDPASAKEATGLAAAIARDAAGDPAVLAWARTVAEAELALVRVRLVRAQLAESSAATHVVFVKKFVKMLTRKRFLDRLDRADETEEDLDDIFAETFYEMFGFPETPAEQQVDVLKYTVSELAKLDRYERRALSRRRAAIRAFDQAMADHARARAIPEV